MVMVTTNFGKTRESARQIRVEPTGAITQTNVQKALEELSTLPPTLSPTAVDSTMSPYNVLIADTLLYVDTSGGAVTINLMPTANRFGRGLTIKDVSGNAATNNISVVASGAETTDGLATYPINSDFGGIRVNPTTDGYTVAP